MIHFKIKGNWTVLHEHDRIELELEPSKKKTRISFWRNSLRLIYEKEDLVPFIKDFEGVGTLNIFEKKVAEFKQKIMAFSTLDLEIPKYHGLERLHDKITAILIIKKA